jgi:hypothetical protein
LDKFSHADEDVSELVFVINFFNMNAAKLTHFLQFRGTFVEAAAKNIDTNGRRQQHHEIWS